MDWAEAHINLIDALRTMIRVDMRLGQGLFDTGEITRAQYDAGMAEVRAMQRMLAELEQQHEIDPTLDGVIK